MPPWWTDLDLGIEFDIWWHSPEELQRDLVGAGFDVVFWAGVPPIANEAQPQGYLVLTRQHS